MTISSAPALTPGAFLRAPAHGWTEPPPNLWGFGGLHGGLALALAVNAMTGHAPGQTPQSATIRFHRPVTGPFRLETDLVRAGRTLSTATARIFTDRGPHADATAVFGSAQTGAHRVVTPPAPAAPPPESCERFTVPPEFVPVTAHLEIRPVGAARPYAGGADPELTAWIRLTEDDAPPDFPRLAFLMDALAPSYAAVLAAPVPVPTVQLAVRPGLGLAAAASPWILLRAVTHSATEDGWIDEHLDAWSPRGAHLGSARQLRLVRTA